jgi:hypothetical protein
MEAKAEIKLSNTTQYIPVAVLGSEFELFPGVFQSFLRVGDLLQYTC